MSKTLSNNVVAVDADGQEIGVVSCVASSGRKTAWRRESTLSGPLRAAKRSCQRFRSRSLALYGRKSG